jgi:hypothetical protein
MFGFASAQAETRCDTSNFSSGFDQHCGLLKNEFFSAMGAIEVYAILFEQQPADMKPA